MAPLFEKSVSKRLAEARAGYDRLASRLTEVEREIDGIDEKMNDLRDANQRALIDGRNPDYSALDGLEHALDKAQSRARDTKMALGSAEAEVAKLEDASRAEALRAADKEYELEIAELRKSLAKGDESNGRCIERYNRARALGSKEPWLGWREFGSPDDHQSETRYTAWLALLDAEAERAAKPPQTLDPLRAVRFLAMTVIKGHSTYSTGEVAGFPTELAARLIAQGRAVWASTSSASDFEQRAAVEKARRDLESERAPKPAGGVGWAGSSDYLK